MSLVTIKNKEGDWYTVSFFLNQVYIYIYIYIYISDYLMFGFSLSHSETGGRTPIAITSSRSAHKCS